MKMKSAGLSVLLILAFVLAACAPGATATPVMEDEMMEEEGHGRIRRGHGRGNG